MTEITETFRCFLPCVPHCSGCSFRSLSPPCSRASRQAPSLIRVTGGNGEVWKAWGCFRRKNRVFESLGPCIWPLCVEGPYERCSNRIKKETLFFSPKADGSHSATNHHSRPMTARQVCHWRVCCMLSFQDLPSIYFRKIHYIVVQTKRCWLSWWFWYDFRPLISFTRPQSCGKMHSLHVYTSVPTQSATYECRSLLRFAAVGITREELTAEDDKWPFFLSRPTIPLRHQIILDYVSPHGPLATFSPWTAIC